MAKLTIGSIAPAIVLLALAPGCGRDSTPTETNLLVNGSFERFVGDVPEGWRVLNYRGLQTMKAVTYGASDSLAFDGERSFYFKGEPDTKRFFLLSQEVEVKNVRRVRFSGMLRWSDLKRGANQYLQANIALTFYDADRGRFVGGKVWDAKTPSVVGSSKGWVRQERIVAVPEGTTYITMHCIMGQSGTVWFDDLSLDVPTGLEWKKRESGNFVYHWLPGHEYPEGANEFQQKLYDQYAGALGIPDEKRRTIFYYLYPDSASLHEATGVVRFPYVNYEIGEIHSIHPADDHEIIHLLTHPYGTLPQALSEGTAFFLIGTYKGEYIQPAAQRLMREGELPALQIQLSPNLMRQVDPNHVIIGGASFVGYIFEFGGPELFLKLHEATDPLAGFDNFAQAFAKTYGGPLDEAQKDWIRKLRNADFSRWTQPQEQDSVETTPGP